MRFRGSIDGVTDKQVRGWAVDMLAPERPANIQIFLGDDLIAEAMGDIPRRDIEESLKAPRSGFVVELPGEVTLSAHDVIERLRVVAQREGESRALPMWDKVRAMMLARIVSQEKLSLPEYFTPCDPLKFERVERDALMSCQRPSIWLPDGPDLRPVTRRGALFHDKPQGTHIFDDLTKDVPFLTPPAAVVSGSPLVLVGTNTFLTKSGQGFFDCLYPDTGGTSNYFKLIGNHYGFENHKTGIVATDEIDKFILKQKLRPVELISEPHFFIPSFEPDNWGSFLFRILAKCRLKNLWPEIPTFYCDRFKSMSDLLVLGCGDIKNTRHNADNIYIFERPIIPLMNNYTYYLNTESVEFFDKIRRKCIRNTIRKRNDIYISRFSRNNNQKNYRKMKNEQILISELQKEGVSIVEPELLTAEDQVRVFANARIVVGPSGAGMFNTIFCEPGTFVIDIESEPYWGIGHANLFSSAGLNYGIVEALADENSPHPIHRNFTVDVPTIVSRYRWARDQIA